MDYEESSSSGLEQMQASIHPGDSSGVSSSSYGIDVVCGIVETSNYSGGGGADVETTNSGNSTSASLMLTLSSQCSVSVSIVYNIASFGFSSPVSINPCLDSPNALIELVDCRQCSHEPKDAPLSVDMQGVNSKGEGVNGSPRCLNGKSMHKVVPTNGSVDVHRGFLRDENFQEGRTLNLDQLVDCIGMRVINRNGFEVKLLDFLHMEQGDSTNRKLQVVKNYGGKRELRNLECDMNDSVSGVGRGVASRRGARGKNVVDP